MCAIFIITGVWKFVDFNGVSQEMEAKGFPMVSFFLITAAILEILGGLSLLFGYKTRLWAVILMLYLIPVTLIFHNFWNAAEGQKYIQIIEFLKNLTIIGGLWDVIGAGPGRISLDSLTKK
jgi:putative oxidoreductase